MICNDKVGNYRRSIECNLRLRSQVIMHISAISGLEFCSKSHVFAEEFKFITFFVIFLEERLCSNKQVAVTKVSQAFGHIRKKHMSHGHTFFLLSFFYLYTSAKRPTKSCDISKAYILRLFFSNSISVFISVLLISKAGFVWVVHIL